MIPWFLLIIFIFGDPLVGDRGHESYSSTLFGEFVEDYIFPVYYAPMYLTSMLHMHYEHSISSYLEKILGLGALLLQGAYWYMLSCAVASAIQRKRFRIRKKHT